MEHPVTDLDRIRRDLVACRDIPWSCSCVEPEQLAALVDEVEYLRGEAVVSRSGETWLTVEIERLRAQNAELELGVATMRARMAKAYEQRNDERAAVVAYLRALADAAGARDLYWQGVASGNGYAAQMIERGEHRREEEK
jgi:hypothetical protein